MRAEDPAPSTSLPLRPSSPWAPAIGFVLAALACSWLPWLALVLTTGDPLADPRSTLLWIAGGYGPPVAAILVVAIHQGRTGLRRLLGGLLRWRWGRWYLVLLLPMPIAFMAVLTAVARGQATLEVAGAGTWLLMPAMLAGGVVLGGFEEIGWRGYLLPLLQERVGALTASVAIGLVWALWHAPLFYLESTSQASFSPVWFTVHAVALSVVLTWAYNGSGGSLLLAVLLHGAANGWYEVAVSGLAPDAVAGFLPPATVLWALTALWLLRRHGPAALAGRPRQRWMPSAG